MTKCFTYLRNLLLTAFARIFERKKVGKKKGHGIKKNKISGAIFQDKEPPPTVPPIQQLAPIQPKNGCFNTATIIIGILAILVPSGLWLWDKYHPNSPAPDVSPFDSGTMNLPRVDTSLPSQRTDTTEFGRMIYKSNPIKTDTTLPIKGLFIRQFSNPDFANTGIIKFDVGNNPFYVPARALTKECSLFQFSPLSMPCLPPIFIGAANNRLYLSTNFFEITDKHLKIGSLQFNHYDVVKALIYPKVVDTDSSLIIQDKTGHIMFSALYKDLGVNNCKILLAGYLVDPNNKTVSIFAPATFVGCTPDTNAKVIDTCMSRLIAK